MDQYTKEHLHNWIESTVLSGYKAQTENMIICFVNKFPDVIEKNYTWRRISELAVVYFENN